MEHPSPTDFTVNPARPTSVRGESIAEAVKRLEPVARVIGRALDMNKIFNPVPIKDEDIKPEDFWLPKNE